MQCCPVFAGAYLLGVMPPELLKVTIVGCFPCCNFELQTDLAVEHNCKAALQILNVNMPLKRRDPHYFLPTTGRY